MFEVYSPKLNVRNCSRQKSKCLIGFPIKYASKFQLFIIAIILLALYNLFVTFGVTTNQSAPSLVPGTIVYKIQCAGDVNPKSIDIIGQQQSRVGQQADSTENLTINFNAGLGRWDNQRRYKLFDNVIVGNRSIELSRRFMTTLATQSSLDRLQSLIKVGESWKGAISLATFVTTDNELNALLAYVTYLRRCHHGIRDQVSWHVAIAHNVTSNAVKRLLDPNEEYQRNTLVDQLDCSNPTKGLRAVLCRYGLRDVTTVNPRWRIKTTYPQNHLRNMAKNNSQTKYVFLTDVDIVPSRNIVEELEQFLRAQKTSACQKCVYVVPTFELDERVRFPQNKSELLRLANKGLAQPFHHKVFIYNQFATNFSRWQSINDTLSVAHVSHPVTNFEFFYEPFYVALKSVPNHDERFIGYGFTRNTQVYEMFIAGYEFLVLSPIFSCHWGLQTRNLRPRWREQQNNLNRRLFIKFKEEIFTKYNKTHLKSNP